MNIFLCCNKTKAKRICAAKDMYLGSFRQYLVLARYITNDAHIFVLSAKYGLLRLNDVISPYNKTLIGASKEEIQNWGGQIFKQSQERNISLNNAIYFLPKDYMEGIYPYVDISTIKEPFKGLGLFERSRRLCELVKKIQNK